MKNKKEIDRRKFLSFLGVIGPGAILASAGLAGCDHKKYATNKENIEFLLEGISPDSKE